MSEKKNAVWGGIALPLSVVFLAAVYYIKVPEVQKAVDSRTPVVHNLLGRFIAESGTKVVILPGEQDPAFAKPMPAHVAAPVEAIATPAPVIAKAPQPVAAPEAQNTSVIASAAPVSAAADIQTIAGDRAKWPKKVVLTKAAMFPAVLNGKVVGTVVAPAGSEANVVQMKDDKVGLEFNGGGAWVRATETDLLVRVRSR